MDCLSQIYNQTVVASLSPSPVLWIVTVERDELGWGVYQKVFHKEGSKTVVDVMRLGGTTNPMEAIDKAIAITKEARERINKKIRIDADEEDGRRDASSRRW